jgi:histidinol dehydrogenase
MKIYKWNMNSIPLQIRLAERRAYRISAKADIEKQVEKIFWDVVKGRDKKLLAYTKKFEGHSLTVERVRVSQEELKEAWRQVPKNDVQTILLATRRIERFHKKQQPRQFVVKEKLGAILEQRVVPLDRVGICIPGGRAPLFSTVLMTSIPAKIAGVKEIALISPWPNGRMNPYILVAAQIVEVNEIYKVGGAQGVAALAYGLDTIPKVDKIVGPGSIWVSEAKRYAANLGWVGIDTLAGPSEVVALADGSCPASFVASDFLSQLEHGEDSIATLVTPQKEFAEKVVSEVNFQAIASKRKKYIRASLKNFATAIYTQDMEQAVEVVNWLAPEHLEILVKRPREVLRNIKNAASIFLGPYSPVPIGDYLAGPNHVLPTDDCARFASPLGVEDFVKRQSVVEFSKEALLKLGPVAERMAEMEGLDGHAAAIRIRREALAKEKPRKKRGRK